GAVGSRGHDPPHRARGRGHPPPEDGDRLAEGLDLLRPRAVRPPGRRRAAEPVRAVRERDLRGPARRVGGLARQQAHRRQDDPQRRLPGRPHARVRVRRAGEGAGRQVRRADLPLHGTVAALQLRQHPAEAGAGQVGRTRRGSRRDRPGHAAHRRHQVRTAAHRRGGGRAAERRRHAAPGAPGRPDAGRAGRDERRRVRRHRGRAAGAPARDPDAGPRGGGGRGAHHRRGRQRSRRRGRRRLSGGRARAVSARGGPGRTATGASADAPTFHFFAGKGGVGKTTCAAATALMLAEDGHRVLVVSTDPAHSLSDVFARRLGGTPRRLPARRGSLRALELDADRALVRWLTRRRSTLRTIAERGTYLDDEDLGRLLRLSFPGVDELMGLVELARVARQGRYETVVVDTAPTGHALRLLAMPQTLRRIAAVLNDMYAKHRFLAESLGRGYRPDDADRLIEELETDGRELTSLLQAPERCRFSWVLLPETLALAEARDGVASLAASDIGVS